ncbi:MAG: vWA domain-containing protein [Limisphaerales bacterium]
MPRRVIQFLCLAAALPWLAVGQGTAVEPATGVAVAIVMDTSGSMRDRVKDASGTPTAKHVIASRALTAVVDRLDQSIKASPVDAPLRVEAGLVVFDQNQARWAIPFGSFDAVRFRNWIARAQAPDGATPLGRATQLAANTVLASPCARKHVLVITDGENTVGPEPASLWPGLRRQAEQAQAAVAFHFVAFDVDAKVFEPLKRFGTTLVGAANEVQLNQQLQLILDRKILLEDEEPSTAPAAKTP